MSPRRINQLSLLLLLAGLAAGVTVYLTAPPVDADPLGGELLSNKKHLHQLRVMGGEANVVFAEFHEWFLGLWRGPQLGLTIGVLTLGAVGIFRFLAAHPDLLGFEPVRKPPPGAS